MKICTGVGITLSIVIAIWILVSLIVTVKVVHNVKECVHPKNFEMKEIVYKEDYLHRIDFSVVTGYVNIGFHDKNHVTIKHFDRFKKGFDPKTSSSTVKMDKGLITIMSETPAFEFSTCQHVSVEVLIPRKYARPITFTGIVKTGAVFIEGERAIPVGSVDIIVEVGHIDVKHLNAHAVSLASEVGYIKVKDVLSASGVKLNVHTGSIKSKQIVTKSFNANVKYGLSRHKDLIADVVNVETNWGYSTVNEVTSFEKLQNVSVMTTYGKSLLLLNNPHVNFNLSNKKGDLLVDYKDKEYKCNVFFNKTVNVLGGKCSILSGNSPSNQAYITVDTLYGKSEIVLDRE